MPGLIHGGYVIDSGAIIDLWRQYPPRTFGSLWQRLEKLAREGRLACPKEVLAELRRKDDEASDWIESRQQLLLVREDAKIWTAAAKIANDHLGLVKPEKVGPQADPFVIALAKLRGWAVVTSEKSRGFGAVNIPSVCHSESVRCMTVLDLFEAEGWHL